MSVGKEKSTWTGVPRQHLVDDMFSAYDGWLEECVRVRQCYSRWTDAPRAERALAFAAYTSALDREESAAYEYRQVISRLS